MKPGIWQRYITLAAGLFALGGTAQANLIDNGLPYLDGEIAFGGFNVTGIFGSAVPTGGTTLGDATGIDFTSSNITVLGGTEDFASVPTGNSATFYDITFNPSAPANPLWTIDTGTTFFSLSIDNFYINSQNNTFLDIWGRGTMSATGFRDTEATWAFSLNQAGDTISVWASTTTVPEPGTLGLFGIALAGIGLLRRRPQRPTRLS